MEPGALPETPFPVAEARLPPSAAPAGHAALPALAAPSGLSRAASLALVGLFLLAAFWAIAQARSLLLPIVLALLLRLLVAPIADGLRRRRVPAALSAALIVGALLGASALAVSSLADPGQRWIKRAVPTLQSLERKLRALRGPVEQVSRATAEVEKLARTATGAPKTETVVVRQASLTDILMSQTGGLFGVLGVTLVLLYFLLASDGIFLRRLVRLQPTYARKRGAVRLLRRLRHELSRFLLTITVINAAQGALVGLAMWAIGLPNATLWGVVAALLNFIPYVGPMAAGAILAVVSLTTFESTAHGLLAPLVFLLITATEGYVVTPYILGRRLALSPVLIVLSLLFWGWLWGIPGALLAVPLLAVLRLAFEQIESTRRYAELLG